MLLQSYSGIIEVFPAVPAAWGEISFTNLRAEGAFIVSAKMKGGYTSEIKVLAERTGELTIRLPFKTFYLADVKKPYRLKDDILVVHMNKNEVLLITNKYE